MVYKMSRGSCQNVLEPTHGCFSEHPGIHPVYAGMYPPGGNTERVSIKGRRHICAIYTAIDWFGSWLSEQKVRPSSIFLVGCYRCGLPLKI